jgi:hypothetical protein
VFTEAVSNPPKIKAKGELDGAVPAEIPFAGWARTSVVLEVKGPKALAPRITALRAPSGAIVGVTDGAEILVDELGEEGTWFAIVEGNPGVAGKVKLQGKATWLDGDSRTR